MIEEETRLVNAAKTLFFYKARLAAADCAIDSDPKQVIVSLLADLKLYCAEHDIKWAEIEPCLNMINYVNDNAERHPNNVECEHACTVMETVYCCGKNMTAEVCLDCEKTLGVG